MKSAATLPVVMSLLVLCGALFMVAAILAGQKLKRQIPELLLSKWNHMSLLMQFFLVGYVLFFLMLVNRFTVPTELITAPVFLAGAIFVFIVIRLTQQTIGKIKQTDDNLRLLNESLEQRVAERTRDLDALNESLENQVFERTRELLQSSEFFQSVLDSMSDEVLIIDADTMNIVRSNTAFLLKRGVREDAIVGRRCYEVMHHRQTVCEPPDLACPLQATVETGTFSTAVHRYHDAGGNERFSDVTSSPIRDAAGRIVWLVHVIRDSTQRRLDELSIRESEERYRRLVEVSPDGISLHIDETFVFVNPAGARLLGATHPDQMIGMSAWEIVHPESREIEESRLQQLGINADTVPWTEEKYLRLDGIVIDVEVVGVHFSYQGKTAVQTIFRDITERKQVAQRIERLALYDTLTGLPNRTLFFDRFNRALAGAERNRSGFALLYMDLDDFKDVNDTLGHEAGDQLLREVAQRMVEHVRKMDTIARVGGDEFVGISGTITTREDAGAMAEKLIAALSEPFELSGRQLSIGVSIGISVYPSDGDDVTTLLSKADVAMYRAKKCGKNHFMFHAESQPGANRPLPSFPRGEKEHAGVADQDAS